LSSKVVASDEKRDIKQGKRREIETRRRDQLHEYFRELQPPCDERFVVGIGKFSTESRQKHPRENEDADRQRDLGPRLLAAEAKENQHRQQQATEIVVERREELAPKQRPEVMRRPSISPPKPDCDRPRLRNSG
jgi:hypothetical protein